MLLSFKKLQPQLKEVERKNRKVKAENILLEVTALKQETTLLLIILFLNL